MNVGSMPDLVWRVERVEDLARVRHELRQLVGMSADGDFVDDVVLVTHELLANCLVHTGGDCTISAWLARGPSPRVRVEVRDAAEEQAPTRTGEPHRGLTIVDQLATSWGVERRTEGKIVWFELDGPASWSATSDGAGDRR
jgi:hypothetical protein